MEELDLKWQMELLFVRVNKYEKKSGRKINFDGKEAERFNRKMVKCHKCQQTCHFARECRSKVVKETKDIIPLRFNKLERRKLIQKLWSLLINCLIGMNMEKMKKAFSKRLQWLLDMTQKLLLKKVLSRWMMEKLH